MKLSQQELSQTEEEVSMSCWSLMEKLVHDGPLGGSAKWARSFDDKAVADHNVPFHDGPKGGSAKRARSFDDKAVADHNVPFPPKASASVRDAMRTEAVEAGWISPEPEPPPRIVVINSCTGEKMLNVTPDDIDWPAGMGFREMVIADLRDMCGISDYGEAFWDVIHGSKVCEHRRRSYLAWNHSLLLVQTIVPLLHPVQQGMHTQR